MQLAKSRLNRMGSGRAASLMASEALGLRCSTVNATPGIRPSRSSSRRATALRSETLLMIAGVWSGHLHQRHFVAEHAGFVFLRDHMPVRIDFRIAQNRGDSIFKSLRDEVFQPFCFLVHFVPGVLQNVVKKQFQQAVVPDQFPRPPFAGRREPDTSMLFIQNQGRALRRQLLKHSGHRRRANSQPLGQGVGRDARILRAPQFQNGLEVVVDGFRRRERHVI